MIFDGFGCLPNANNSYCAAGHLKLWPGFRGAWERVGVKHLLGFNEPDIAAAGEYKTPQLAVPAQTFLRFRLGASDDLRNVRAVRLSSGRLSTSSHLRSIRH